ncbi:MAG: type II secretion system F family protein [Thiotrichaceae bacterium]|nr:type II secretion system F family protein [Thiotrichaceae bacterium]
MATKTMQSSLDYPTFIWEGKTKDGVKIRGEDRAPNANMLKAILHRKGYRIRFIKAKSKPLFKQRIKSADIAYFARQLTSMMRSGIPLMQSLEIISSAHDNPSMQELIITINKDIATGTDFAGALSRHPRYFDELFINLIAAGEKAGTLEDMLERIATYKEKTENLKAKIKKAMTYPITIIIVALVVTGIMMIFVIPQFKELFTGFGAELPAFTLMIVNMSEWLEANWWIPLGLIIAGIFVFIRAKRSSKKFNHFLDRLVLKMPIFGNLVDKSAIARFSRTLATMSASGIPIVEALESVAGATGNIVYQTATLEVRSDVSKGVQLNQAMRTTQAFPNMVIQMTKVAEESGRLEEMLSKVADYYEDQVDDLVDSLSKQIEPIIMAILGVLVGGMVIAMYLPIFKLGSAI